MVAEIFEQIVYKTMLQNNNVLTWLLRCHLHLPLAMRISWIKILK